MIHEIRELFSKYLIKFNSNIVEKCDFSIPPKEIDNYDIATNICMICSKKYSIKIDEISSFLIENLSKYSFFKEIHFTKGFLNIKLSDEFLINILDKCIEEKKSYGNNKIGEGRRINLEFISANPTGPLHIGHLRNAIIGECLSRVFKKCGFYVEKEYYINDAGSQIDNLIQSVKTRFEQLKNNNFDNGVPDGCYPGEYIIDIARELPNNFDFSLEKSREIIIEKVMTMIKQTIFKLGIEYGTFSSEKMLHENGRMEELVDILQKQDLVYKGKMEKPKGKDVEDYEEKELLLFKSSVFGDEIDRPLKKSTGEWVYFASDGAYSLDKYRRGFNRIILLLGVDHKGFVKRWTGISKAAINDKNVELHCMLSDLVNFKKNGEIVKMSKRKGNFLLIDDVIEEVDVDILKFILLTKKNTTSIDFDFEKVKEQSKDNPVFYVQYASSRCNSVLSKIDTKKIEKNDILENELKELIVKIMFFEDMIKKVSNSMETNLICNYLIEISELFHKIWHSDIDLKNSNINTYKTLLAFKNTLECGLDLMNIKALISI